MPKHNKPAGKAYARYGGMAIKMVAIMLGGVYGGKWLDSYFSIEHHIFALVLSLLSVILAMYVIIKDLIK